MLLIVGLRLVPMLMAVGLSFTDTNVASAAAAQFVGLQNYATVIGSEDFPSALFVTVAIVVPALVLEMLIGLSIALWLSKDVMEAALVDGANAWQRFTQILLPALLPILGAVLVLRGMDAIQLFDEVYVLTGGGPGRETSVINLYLYQFGFRQFRMGETSSAITLLLGVVIMVALIVSVLRRMNEAKAVRR